ncbi:fungal-specific transcription factor domain-containing protein [Xylaria bambusicola]|uniref:fungal-specific transcription factor domain-containing protein n=1 Tax=Xylaria bambusicola TaxID=326684 RepID=UPI0020073386|nr:fungal-specific transcription factor domain-containing protein [Xylaria bambusicola]KAI0514846.1 fungal-specific transcription factor domain-containing protein [Xylaria bambusicola]
MESRGDAANVNSSRRLAIPRRSCDQCRSRKVGCDRGSPCSNCVSAKLACTFGVVTPKTTAAKQRVLISAQYEQKIDDIAEGLESIKALLQNSHIPISQEWDNTTPHVPELRKLAYLTPKDCEINPSKEPAEWDHPTQVNDFVKTVVEHRALQEGSGAEESHVLASLRGLARALEESNAIRDLSFPGVKDVKIQDRRSMPPIEVAVFALRWAKEHKMFFRIDSLSRILPLQRFTDICQKVYFAVEDYSQFDFILANCYLSYVFSEYNTLTGKDKYRDYYRQCRLNAQFALSQLPLLLPATTEAVATLTFGASYAIESSRATLAWTYISSAANLCQTLRLHRLPNSDQSGSSQDSQASLFWLVFLLEKSLALRLGRPSILRDSEITTPLPSQENMKRCSQTSIIQGKIYDELYSPPGLARPESERGAIAQILATELRGLIDENKLVLQVRTEQDKMRDVYFKIELVKQLSLLTLVLRAVPAPPGASTSITEACAATALEALDMHQECMAAIEANKNDRFMTDRYLHWGILHTPFVPFSVLFTRIVQLSDSADLFYLDRFAGSLYFGESSAGSVTHPYRLYKLLCEAARLYIKQDPPSVSYETDMSFVDPWGVFDFASLGMEANNGADNSGLDSNLNGDLSLWFYGNQQLMGLLDDDVMF